MEVFMSGTFYKKGDYNIICDQSGFKIKASDSRKQWDNLKVDKKFFEIRNPQDFVRTRPDRQAVPDPRTEGEDVFLSPGDVTPGDL